MFKDPIMVPLGECESQGKIWTNGELLEACQWFRGVKKEPKKVKIEEL